MDVDLVVVVVVMAGFALKISQIVEKLTPKEGIVKQHGGTYLIPKNRGTGTKRNILISKKGGFYVCYSCFCGKKVK